MTVVPGVAELAPTGSPLVARAPGFLRRVLRRPSAIVCLVYLAVLVGIAILAPIVWPAIAKEHAGDLLAVRKGPSGDHLLGTDTLGRDVLQRLLVGTRVSLVGVAESLLVVVGLGLPLGIAAGFMGGWIDRSVNWLADLTFSMPGIVIIVVVLSVFPQSMLAGMTTFGALAAPSLMRVVRSATLPVREELYIAAARVSGLSRAYIMSRHILPRIAGPVIVQSSLLAAAALLVQSGLAFLNLLVAAPAPSWGGMVADGVGAIELQPWLIWPPGMAITITVLALGQLGDAIRDANVETWTVPTRRRRPGRRRGQSAAEASPQASPTLLSIEGLTISIPSSRGLTRVVEGVTFDVRAGEVVGLVGESGCGKTVTALSVLGLVPGGGEVDEGRILFKGRDLAAMSERELQRIRGKEIALVSQEPTISLDPAFRIGWQLAEAVRIHHRVSRRAAHARARELLRRVHLPDSEAVASRYPHQVSGGMAQRIAIARALAGEPRLLIADEPTTALDVTIQAEILDLLRELQRDRDMALLLVTHDWGVVADICERAVVMYAGQVVERAEIGWIFRNPLHPYTEALLASDPHGVVEATRLPAIDGTVPAPGTWPRGCRFHPRCPRATSACREGAIVIERPVPGRETRCIHYERLLNS